jgi:TonB-dependent SusC/RagA subfamily outer membrane receptor
MRRQQPITVEAHMSLHALSPIAIVALATTLACAPRGQTTLDLASDRPQRGTSVLNTSGKTMEDLFSGRFAGVTATRAQGGGLQIRIRGGSNTFFGSNEPLYVLDEVPLPPDPRGIVFLSPHDIERIEVLKNPADVGIYGIRGGNGVVKITTKRPR